MTTKKIAGTALMMALTIVLTVASNYIQIGTISINLSLIPIALAAILYGPLCGFLCGLVNGAFVMLAPSTSAFFAISAVGTVVVCLLKTSLAGLASGFIYKCFKKHHLAGSIVSSIVVPVLNTSFFILGALIFFRYSFGSLITLFVSVNFAIEIGVTVVLSPSVAKIVEIFDKKQAVK